MSNQIKVLMLVPSLRIGSGVSSFAMSYFRKLDKSKVHIDFACYFKREPSFVKELDDAGSEVYYLPSVFNLKKHIEASENIILNGKYNIIHDNTLINSIPFMSVAKRYVKIRILHSHSSKLGETFFKAARNKIFLPWLRNLSTHYAACSALAARALFRESEYDLIPNIIDGSKFYYDEEKRKKIRKEMHVNDKIVIVSVGRGAPQKNPIRALSIMQKVIQKNPTIEYLWAGSGPLLEQMKAFVKDNNMTEHIKILGNRTDVADLYQAMDIFFMPSRFEGLGIACVEAQVAGLRCIVSDAVPKEVAFTNLVDFISLSESDSVWEDKILAVASNLSERKSCKEEFLASDFSDVSAGDRLEKYYRELVR